MKNYMIYIEGAILDMKRVDGQPTCMKLTGEYAIIATCEQSAIDRVVAWVKAKCRFPVRIDKASVCGYDQQRIDRIVKRGGTKAVPLVCEAVEVA